MAQIKYISKKKISILNYFFIDTYFAILKAHFIDSQFELQALDLDLIHIAPPLKGESIAFKLLECLKEWGIDRKIFAITSDSGANCQLAAKLLNGQISKRTSQVFDQIISFHNRCASHSIQIIIKHGLKFGVKKSQDQSIFIALSKIRYEKNFIIILNLK